jgi:hypothetical protein
MLTGPRGTIAWELRRLPVQQAVRRTAVVLHFRLAVRRETEKFSLWSALSFGTFKKTSKVGGSFGENCEAREAAGLGEICGTHIGHVLRCHWLWKERNAAGIHRAVRRLCGIVRMDLKEDKCALTCSRERGLHFSSAISEKTCFKSSLKRGHWRVLRAELLWHCLFWWAGSSVLGRSTASIFRAVEWAALKENVLMCGRDYLQNNIKQVVRIFMGE